MGHMKFFVSLFMMLILVLVIGCSDDDEGPTDNNGETQQPTFSIDSVIVPDAMAQSADPMVQQVVAYITLANAFAAYGSWFSPPTTSEGPPWTYTWTVDNLTITLTVAEEGTNWVWDIVLDGTDGEYTYDNWLFIHAELAKNNSSGQLTIYEPVTTDVSLEWSWNVDTEGVYTLVVISYEEGGFKIEITVNPDDSGELELYTKVGESYQLTFRAVWQADGSGQWWTYEGGQQTGSGSWS
jgi:hypothetical protein